MNASFSVTTRGHRPRLGALPRIQIGSTRVDPTTDAQMAAWMDVLELKQGVLTDKLVRFAITHGFLAWAKKEAGSPSTAHPAKPNQKPQRAGTGSAVNSKA